MVTLIDRMCNKSRPCNNSGLSKRLFTKSLRSILLFMFMLLFTSMTVRAEEKAMTYSQGQELIYQLNNTLAILRSWSNENKTKSDKLETYIKHDNVREQDNY